MYVVNENVFLLEDLETTFTVTLTAFYLYCFSWPPGTDVCIVSFFIKTISFPHQEESRSGYSAPFLCHIMVRLMKHTLFMCLLKKTYWKSILQNNVYFFWQMQVSDFLLSKCMQSIVRLFFLKQPEMSRQFYELKLLIKY